MSNRKLGVVLAISLVGSYSSSYVERRAFAADEDSDSAADAEVNYVDLAARLIHDKHYERALSVLAEADSKAADFDAPRAFMLRGLAYLNLKRFDSARKSFAAAISAGQKDPRVRLYEAQAHWGLRDYDKTLKSLALAGKSALTEPGVWLMKAEAQWKSGKKHAAVITLRGAAKRFSERATFDRMQLFYLIELGLYVEATELGERYLRRKDITEDEYVAVGEALRAAGQPQRAQLILEGAALRYPESDKVMLQLAHSYLDSERTLTAAMLFEKAARLEPKYIVESAELYRRSQMVFRALSLNARVSDQTAKTKQRLSLLVDLERFEAVAAMLPKLKRLGLLKDESIKYALAYAFFKTGRFAEADAQLKSITQPELYESALQLRKAMDSCRAAGWECSP